MAIQHHPKVALPNFVNRLPLALKTQQPAVVLIALGANDGLRGLPFSEMQASLEKMLELCKHVGARVILAGVRLPPNYGPAFTNGFTEMYDKLARENGVPLVPELLRDVSEHPYLMQADGLHPTAQAQPRIVDNVWPTLQDVLAGLLLKS